MFRFKEIWTEIWTQGYSLTALEEKKKAIEQTPSFKKRKLGSGNLFSDTVSYIIPVAKG